MLCPCPLMTHLLWPGDPSPLLLAPDDSKSFWPESRPTIPSQTVQALLTSSLESSNPSSLSSVPVAKNPGKPSEATQRHSSGARRLGSQFLNSHRSPLTADHVIWNESLSLSLSLGFPTSDMRRVNPEAFKSLLLELQRHSAQMQSHTELQYKNNE